MISSLATLPVLLEVFWKSGAALGIALCVNSLLRRKSADLRRLVLSATLVVLLAAAIASPALPRWTATSPAWFHSEQPLPNANEVRSTPVAFATPPAPVQAVTPDLSASVTPSLPIAQRILSSTPILWLTGTVLLLARFVLGLFGLRRLGRASKQLHNPDVIAYLRAIQPRRNITLLQNDAVPAPVTWGIFRPVVLVPTGFETLPAESRNAVICHETAHIQSHDFLVRSLADITRALIWVQPLIWIVRKQLREEQELACDDLVLAAGGKPSAYAKLLLDWDVRPSMASLFAVGMAQQSSLKRRLHALLNQDVRRDRAAGAVVFATWVVALATAFPLAALSFTPPTPDSQLAPPTVRTYRTFTLPELPPQVRSHVALPSPAPSIPAPTLLAQALPAAQTPPPATASPRAVPYPLPTFVARTSLVIEDVSVKDQSGKAIEGLSPDDFAITEDDKPQRVMLAEFQRLDLGSYYVLGYYSTNSKVDGAFRRIGITLRSNPTAKLDFRAGYYAPSAFTSGNIDALTVEGVTDLDAGSKIIPPALMMKYDPEYSEEARKARFSGTVTLVVEINASGQATSVKVVRKLGMGLDEKAMEAVARWKFRPASKDGQPVATSAAVNVSFSLL